MSEISVMIGVIIIVLALTKAVPYQYSAPLEWLGVFCLTGGLTHLYSPSRTVLLAFTAFLFGTFLDPIIVGSQSFHAWIYANLLVFAFALAGTCTSALALRFAAVREL
jgi:hypothetical protein